MLKHYLSLLAGLLCTLAGITACGDSVEWNQKTYFYLTARDLDSGIFFDSEPLYK